jgi:hypothetical protein
MIRYKRLLAAHNINLELEIEPQSGVYKLDNGLNGCAMCAFWPRVGNSCFQRRGDL